MVVVLGAFTHAVVLSAREIVEADPTNDLRVNYRVSVTLYVHGHYVPCKSLNYRPVGNLSSCVHDHYALHTEFTGSAFIFNWPLGITHCLKKRFVRW